jgi:transposase-like protein
VDETYARIRGRWHIYRAIDGHGQIVDACVSSTRDMVAAHRFFKHAIASSGTSPRRIITDKAVTFRIRCRSISGISDWGLRERR